MISPTVNPSSLTTRCATSLLRSFASQEGARKIFLRFFLDKLVAPEVLQNQIEHQRPSLVHIVELHEVRPPFLITWPATNTTTFHAQCGDASSDTAPGRMINLTVKDPTPLPPTGGGSCSAGVVVVLLALAGGKPFDQQGDGCRSPRPPLPAARSSSATENTRECQR